MKVLQYNLFIFILYDFVEKYFPITEWETKNTDKFST